MVRWRSGEHRILVGVSVRSPYGCMTLEMSWDTRFHIINLRFTSIKLFGMKRKRFFFFFVINKSFTFNYGNLHVDTLVCGMRMPVDCL